MEILKVFALLMLSYGLVSSAETADLSSTTSAATTSTQEGGNGGSSTTAAGSNGGDGGNNPATTQAPAATTLSAIDAGKAALSEVAEACTPKNTGDNCDTTPVNNAKNQTTLCSTFKTYLNCTQNKCKNDPAFQTATDVANNFLSTHCSSAVLTQGSMALAITLAWLSAYISGKL